MARLVILVCIDLQHLHDFYNCYVCVGSRCRVVEVVSYIIDDVLFVQNYCGLLHSHHVDFAWVLFNN